MTRDLTEAQTLIAKLYEGDFSVKDIAERLDVPESYVVKCIESCKDFIEAYAENEWCDDDVDSNFEDEYKEW